MCSFLGKLKYKHCLRHLYKYLKFVQLKNFKPLEEKGRETITGLDNKCAVGELFEEIFSFSFENVILLIHLVSQHGRRFTFLAKKLRPMEVC